MKGKFVSILSVIGLAVSAVTEYGFDMDFPLTPAVWLVIAVFALSVTPAYGQVNSWINTASGTWAWATAGNWSLAAAPSLNQSGLFITNAVSAALPTDRFRIVSIDSTTPAGSMSISNLMVANLGAGSTASRSFLSLNNAGTVTPFHIYGSLVISNNASVSITNSVLIVKNPGNDFILNNGSLVLNTGSLVTTGDYAFVVGWSGGVGQMAVQDGTWQALDVIVGSFGQGTLTLAGGTNSFGGAFRMADGNPGTGTVWITGGLVTATNATTSVGSDGVGQLIVSNGTVRLKELEVGSPVGPLGTITIAGGTTTIASNLTIGGLAGRVWITGGHLTAVGSIQVGETGGQMAVSNGTVSVNELFLPNENVLAFTSNTLVIAGGTLSVYSNMQIGSSCVSTVNEVGASVTMTGGNLYVTNVAHNATLYIPDGNFTQSGGTLVVDQFVVVDACGHFTHSGGALSITSTNLGDPNFSTAGDGIPNGWKQQYGLDVFDPNLAGADTDGDGQNNLAEYLAGTNPTNNLSALRIVSFVPQGDDIRIRWTAAGGHTSAVQATDGTATGSFTNDFNDLVWFFMGGTGDKTNTYIDFGGATGTTSRFYRIRLVP